MPNVINHAEVWQPELLEIINQNALCSPFITTNVRWLDAKTFHFTSMSTSGFKSHDRNGGWNRGTFKQTDHPYTVTHDRDIEFLVDKADVDESNATASYDTMSVRLLLRWGKSQPAAEAKARCLWSLFYGLAGVDMDGAAVSFADPGAAPVSIGKGSDGVFEYVINLNITYRKE